MGNQAYHEIIRKLQPVTVSLIQCDGLAPRAKFNSTEGDEIRTHLIELREIITAIERGLLLPDLKGT